VTLPLRTWSCLTLRSDLAEPPTRSPAEILAAFRELEASGILVGRWHLYSDEGRLWCEFDTLLAEGVDPDHVAKSIGAAVGATLDAP
jgi:hypothetical protein